MLLNGYGLRAAAAAAIFLISPEFASSANSRVAAIGPIEQLDCAAGTYRVLGIKFTAISRSMLSGVCESQSSLGVAYVVATGVRSEPGKTVGGQLAEVRSDLYVPGATSVFVRGLVSRTKSGAGGRRISRHHWHSTSPRWCRNCRGGLCLVRCQDLF